MVGGRSYFHLAHWRLLMDKARFNLRTLFSSPLNRRRLLTSATATGAAGAMLGTFAPIAHAQPHPGPWGPVLGQPHEGHVPNFQTTSLSCGKPNYPLVLS